MSIAPSGAAVYGLGMASGNGSNGSHGAKYAAGTRASELTLERSAVRAIEADIVRLERSAVQRLRARQADMAHSAVAVAVMERGTIRESTVGVVFAKSLACDEVRTMVLASPVVRGEVHTWLDLRSAVAIGAGMVLAKAVLALLKAGVRRAF
jgi:hypothetical protein